MRVTVPPAGRPGTAMSGKPRWTADLQDHVAGATTFAGPVCLASRRPRTPWRGSAQVLPRGQEPRAFEQRFPLLGACSPWIEIPGDFVVGQDRRRRRGERRRYHQRATITLTSGMSHPGVGLRAVYLAEVLARVGKLLVELSGQSVPARPPELVVSQVLLTAVALSSLYERHVRRGTVCDAFSVCPWHGCAA